MKKIVRAHFLFIVLLFALITPAYASVTMQAIIDQDVCVTFDFKNMNSTTYWTIKNEGLITESTIPNFILESLRLQDLTHVDCYIPEPLAFNDSALSLRVTFCLYGSDILNFTVNTKSMIRTYYVRTEWRKGVIASLLPRIFGQQVQFSVKQVYEWEKINYTLNGEVHPAYYRDFPNSTLLDLCYFILPAEATNVQAVEDTIIFDLPMPLEDSLLNSPFLILGAIIVIIIAFSLYRKVRK